MLERSLGDADREGRDADAAGVQRLHEVDEPVPLFAQQVLGGHLDVLHDQLGRVRCTPSELVFLFSGSETFHPRQIRIVTDADRLRGLQITRFFREDEGADAARAHATIRHGCHDEDLSHAPVRDESLYAIEDVIAVLLYSRRAGPARVTPGVRLSEPEAAHDTSRG